MREGGGGRAVGGVGRHDLGGVDGAVGGVLGGGAGCEGGGGGGGGEELHC